MPTYRQTLNSRNYSFSATVDAWITDSKKRTDAVFRAALQDLIEEAQRPVAKGGRMRVDTGFLRASGQLSTTGMPSGPARGEGDGAYNWDGAQVTIASIEAGATVYFGWTAAYAKYREAYDGFLISAIQDWQSIVDKHVRRLQARAAFK